MLQEERFVKIIKYLKENKTARYAELIGLLNASENTVRRDLAELDRRGIIKMVRGGAVWGKNDLTKSVYEARRNINQQDKQELVACLGNIIENGQAIAMNGGTTTIEAARYLKQNYDRMTVVTNNLTIVDILKEKRNFKIIVASGSYDRSENTLVGPRAEKTIELYNTDYAILAVNSISASKGITDFRDEEIDIINAMIRNTEKAIVVADHSKFDRISCMNVCTLSDIDYFITDPSIDRKILHAYREKGFNIITP